MMWKIPSREIDPNNPWKKFKRFLKNNKSVLVCLILFFIFLTHFIVLKIIETNIDASKWHSQNLSKWYLFIVGNISSVFPFSLMEISIATIVIVAIVLIILMIKNFVNKKLNKGFFKLAFICTFAMGIISNYEFSVGVSYHKNIYQIQYNVDPEKTFNYDAIVSYFIEDLNNISSNLEFDQNGQVVCPYTLQELAKKIDEEYKKYDSNNELFDFTPTPKYLISSFVFREFQITGVFFGPTAESHLTRGIPNGELAYTLAHELAHAKGNMDEYDCNTIAFDICFNSDDPYLRYSAFFYQINSVLDLLDNMKDKTKDEIKIIKQNHINSINRNFIKDDRYSYEYWQSHKSLKDLSQSINDWYLKTFGKKEGADSYYVDEKAKEEEQEEAEKDPEDRKPVYTKIQKIFLMRYDKEVQ